MEEIGQISPNASCEEIENIRVEKVKERNEAHKHLSTILEAKAFLQRDMIALDAKKIELRISEIKGRQVVKDLDAEIEVLLSKFWHTKRG